MAKLSIANVIRVSLLTALRGLGNVNTSALAIITDEVPIPADYGTSRIYLSPGGVADDFGSNSDTYRMAVVVFSQTPNIITGKGYLVVIPRLQTAPAQPATILNSGPVDLSALTAIDYNINVAISGAPAADIVIGSVDTTSIATIQTDLNNTAITAAGLIFVVTGEVTAARVSLSTIATGATTAIVLATAGAGTDISPILGLSGSATGADTGVERVKDAVLRTAGSVDYFGILINEKQTDANLLELASLIQTYDKLLFVGSNLLADITGVFATIQGAGQNHTRCLYYSISESDAIDFSAGYASRGMSINFDGGLTVITMHLKEITGLVADSGLTQTILTSVGNNGVDVYGDFGVPKVFTSGVNGYFDSVYVNTAFKLRLQIAAFNVLATTTTKIPQTEPGMAALKKSARDVCTQFVRNGAFAPGVWNDATKFGNPEDHDRNILETGFFVYSIPVASQSVVERAARIAPAIQVAAKASGAIHSADITVYVEA